MQKILMDVIQEKQIGEDEDSKTKGGGEGKEGEYEDHKVEDEVPDRYGNAEFIVARASEGKDTHRKHSPGGKEFDLSRPSGILNQLCEVCQEIFENAGLMFRGGYAASPWQVQSVPCLEVEC